MTALKSTEAFTAAADTLSSIVRMSKLRLPKLRLPDEPCVELPTSSAPKTSPKQVVYVRLRRRERANKVVLSSGEKYSLAKAMVEPLLEHLADLSSANFYDELQAWKNTLEEGLRLGKSRTKKSAVFADHENGEVEEVEDLDDDLSSILDPADAMATVKLMEDLQIDNQDGAMDSINSGDDVPPTQLAKEQKVKSPTPPRATSFGEPTSGSKKNETGDVRDEGETTRQVDVINVPKPMRRNLSRTTPTQLRQTKISPGVSRLAVHNYPSGLTVKLHEFVTWARNTPNMKNILAIMQKYPVQLTDAYLRSRVIECHWEAMRSEDNMHPFVIPVDLTRSMEAAICTARKEQREPDKLDSTVSQKGVVLDIVATIDPKLWKFCRYGCFIVMVAIQSCFIFMVAIQGCFTNVVATSITVDM